MGTAAEEAAFEALRPDVALLIHASQRTDADSALHACRRLHQQLQSLDGRVRSSAQLEHFVLLPLRTCLTGGASAPQRLQTALLRLLAQTLATFSSQPPLDRVQALGSLLVGRLLNEASLPSLPEELVLEILQCTSALWARLDIQGLTSLHKESLPFVGHQVFLLLKVLEAESGGLVQKQLALEVLGRATGLGLRSSAQLDQTLASSLAPMLPGISVALGKVASADSALHHSVPKECLGLLGRLVGLVLSDTELAKAPKASLKTSKWMAEAGERLRSLLRHLASRLVAHRHPHVRRQLLKLSLSILAGCSESLKDCHGLFVDVLATLVLDEDAETAARAREGGQTLLSGAEGAAAREVAEEALYEASGRLADRVRRESDEAGRAALRQVSGLWLLLGRRGLRRLCRHSVQRSRLFLSLAHCVVFDLQRAPVIAELSIHSSPSTSSAQSALCGVPLKYPVGEELRGLMGQLAEWSREEGGAELLDGVVLLLKDSQAQEEQSAFLAAALLAASPAAGTAEVAELTEAFVHRLHRLSPVDAEVIDSRVILHGNDGCSLDAVRAELTLRGLSFAAPLLTRPSLELLLLNSLYKQLELGTSQQPNVSEAAAACLGSFARAVELRGSSAASPAAGLAAEFSDYLLSELSLRLAHPRLHPRAPLVLGLLFRLSGRASLIALKPILPLLMRCLDRQHADAASLLLASLHSLVKAVNALPPEDRLWREEKVEDQEPIPTTSTEAATEEEELEEAYPRTEAKAPPPPLVEMVVEVLGKTKHLVNSPHLPLRLGLLECLREGLEAVAEEEDELLPMVHQNWPPVAARCVDAEPGVALRALAVVECMARLTRSFVHWKLEELWPRLLPHLASQAPYSARSGPVYATSTRFRLQRALLTTLPRVAELSKIGPANKQLALEVCALYSASDQPTALAEAAGRAAALLRSGRCDKASVGGS